MAKHPNTKEVVVTTETRVHKDQRPPEPTKTRDQRNKKPQMLEFRDYRD